MGWAGGCVCVLYRAPLLKSHGGSPILQHLPMEGLGEQEIHTFGARMRRAFIPAQPWRWAAGKARVWGVPTAGDTHEHPRPDLAPEGTGGRAAGGPLRAARGRISFQPVSPGRGTGAPA